MSQVIQSDHAWFLWCSLFFQDEPILYVDKQEVEAFKGGSVTVVCYYKSQKVTGWCRLGNPRCVTRQTGSISGATVTINASLPQVFNVTMSELRTESSGWYFCTDGQLQIPVNVIVHESTSATTTATTMSPSVSSKIQNIFFCHRLETYYKKESL